MEPPVFVSFGEVMLRLSPPGHQRLIPEDETEPTGDGEAPTAVTG